ncbi:MAG: endonuclease domain-containing protein [Betaproteobacteria bacterium]
MHGQQVATAKRNSRSLRKQPTNAELVLWRRLRAEQLGAKFRRQHPFLGYVLDFVCLERKLVVELDGGQHLGSKSDEVRDGRLHESGFVVLRF